MGIELGVFLAGMGRDITIVEMLPQMNDGGKYGTTLTPFPSRSKSCGSDWRSGFMSSRSCGRYCWQRAERGIYILSGR